MGSIDIFLIVSIIAIIIAIIATIIMAIALIRFIKRMNELDKQFEQTINTLLEYKRGLDKK
jgi:uncharacterized protein YoxC